MQYHFNRRRNVQEASGEPYQLAFTQTQIMERGWTRSMIRRHLGPPNAVFRGPPLKYQYDRRRVYAAEATPAVQIDLLATENVRILGPKWLSRYAAYVPNIMCASLMTLASEPEHADDFAVLQELIAALPVAKPRVARILPPESVTGGMPNDRVALAPPPPPPAL